MNDPFIGAISEKSVELAFLKAHFWTAKAEPNCVFDLFVSIYENILKVQVKTGKYDPEIGVIVVDLRRNRTNRIRKNNQKPKIFYTSDEINMFAVCCPQLNKVYLIPISQVEGVTGIHLRINDPKPDAIKGDHKTAYTIKWAKDYELTTSLPLSIERIYGKSKPSEKVSINKWKKTLISKFSEGINKLT